jgi:SET domain-containing protein
MPGKKKRTKARTERAQPKRSGAKRKAPAPAEQPFILRRSRIQGRGAFATRPIRKGERIIEYVGERVSAAEADRRYDVPGRHHTFVFSLASGRCIDAAVGGNDARFINHCCAPNCEAIEDRGRVFIDAMRNIAQGEELTYDYSYEPTAGVDEDAEYACTCGARTCRRTIIKRRKRPKRKKKKT